MTENWGSIPEREPEKWLPHLRKAAGTKITQSQHREVYSQEITVQGLNRSRSWNECNLSLLTRINWRASLVPRAAVIPAPIACIKFVTVKKRSWISEWASWYAARWVTDWSVFLRKGCVCCLLSVRRIYNVYFKKIRVLKADYCLNTCAWNNGIGLWSDFVRF